MLGQKRVKFVVCATAMLLATNMASADVLSMEAGLARLETVYVGNYGNAGDWSGEGYGGHGPDRICWAVDYEYSIGKYEVTNGQYCEFLNAVAAQGDTFALYNEAMASTHGGIECNVSGTIAAPYVHTANGGAANWDNRPVNYVSWDDSVRLSNWLTHSQPKRGQDDSTTDDGAYSLNGAMASEEILAVTRNDVEDYFIPTEDEWYQAAYFDPSLGGYWDYPTQSDAVSSNDLTTPDPGSIAAFFDGGYTRDSSYYTMVVGNN